MADSQECMAVKMPGHFDTAEYHLMNSPQIVGVFDPHCCVLGMALEALGTYVKGKYSPILELMICRK